MIVKLLNNVNIIALFGHFMLCTNIIDMCFLLLSITKDLYVIVAYIASDTLKSFTCLQINIKFIVTILNQFQS